MFPTSGIPGYPFGPAPFSTITEVSSISRSGRSMRALKSSMLSNTTARPRCFSKLRRRRRRFDHRAVGRQIAAHHREPGALPDRFRKFVNDFAIPARRIGRVLAHGLAIHRNRIAMDHVRQFANHRRNAACVVEIFHQKLARRLDVHQQRQIMTHAVEIVQRKRHAHATRDRQHVQHEVARPADRRVHANRILERFARQDLRNLRSSWTISTIRRPACCAST